MNETATRRIKRGWMNLRVARIEQETHDTKTLWLVDAEENQRAFDYTAGQYLTFRFDTLAAKPLVRSYTISSSPNQPDAVGITIKTVPTGPVSHWLVETVKVGDILRARGPIGRFVYEAKDQPHLVMIAGGSGVTPFVSILREYAHCLGTPGAPREMTLVVSYRTHDDVIFGPLLNDLRRVPNIHVHVTLTRDANPGAGFLTGRIDKNLLAHTLGPVLSGRTYMTCGPEEMMALTKDYLLGAGVEPACVKVESYAN